MTKLTPIQIAHRMKTVPHWSRRAGAICRSFKFAHFMEGIDFVKRVAKKAEQQDHHPDIDIRWTTVTLTFTTHSKGGLTDSDFSMAAICTGIFEQ